MKVDVETLSPVEKKVSIAVPWDAVKQELDTAYRDLAKRARVKGFRAGKVPRKVLEQFYKQAVEGQVVSQLLDDSFKKAVAEQDLVPIDNPKVEAFPSLTPNEDLTFTATVQVKPEVQVEHYKGLEVEKKIRQVSDAEVDAELAQMREKATVIEPVSDRSECEKGDLAVIDFFGYVDGETFKGGKGINYTVEVGAGQMIEGFEDHLVGMKIGDEKEFRLNFPKGQGPDEVQGKDVDWKVDLKELKTKILPELDDDFAQDLEFESLDALKKSIRDDFEERTARRSKNELRDRLLDKFIAINEIPVPPALLQQQKTSILQEMLQFTQMTGMPLEPGMLEGLDERAERRVQAGVILGSLAKIEGIKLGDEDVDARLAKISEETGKHIAKVKVEYSGERREQLENELLHERLMSFLEGKATIHEGVDPNAEAEKSGDAEAPASDTDEAGEDAADAEESK